MKRRKNLTLVILLVFSTIYNVFAFPRTMVGDTLDCVIQLELEQLENGDYLISMTSDTTWEFPNNVVSTAQITLKVPTGQFEIGSFTNLIESVIFFESSTITQPKEAPEYNYISIGLGSQGTSDIPFEKNRKVNLFTISNSKDCTTGTISLMNNFTDPFILPNEQDANVGQQLTVFGFGLADLPIGIIGEGISCGENNVDNTLPGDTLGLQIVKQDISCAGERDGIIIAKGNGGITPYNYAWSTGDTLSTIEGLNSGTYRITLTDGDGNMVTEEIRIESPSALSLLIAGTDNDASASAPNGIATATVTGGTYPYQYNWGNNQTDSIANGLAGGSYTLTVTDANGCTAEAMVEIDNINCPEINVMLQMNAPLCTGDSTGSLVVSALSGMAPFSYEWGTGETSDTLSNIPMGNYMVSVSDVHGCSMSFGALLPDATPIEIMLDVSQGTGNSDGAINATLTGGMSPYIYEWNTGSTASSINNLESGVYDLVITDANGCTQNASAVIDGEACKLGLLEEYAGSILLDTISCFLEGELCLPVPLDSMINYSLFVDGVSYMSNLTGCRYDTFYAYTYFTLPGRGSLGPYELDEWPVNGQNFSGQFSTIADLVDSLNTWDPVGNWMLEDDIAIIQGGLPSNTYGEMVIRTPVTNSITTIDLNTNLTPTGTLISFQSGNHEVVLVDKSTTCSDTLRIEQPCTDEIRKDTIIRLTVEVGAGDTLDLAGIFGPDLEVSANQCPESMDGNASIVLNTVVPAIQVAGLLEGQDEACFRILDADSVVISLTLQVNVIPEEIECDPFIPLDTFTISVADCQDFQICVPLVYDSLLKYAITDNGAVFSGIVSACDNETGSLLSFSSAQTHELIFSTSDNCKDTTIIAINAPGCDEDLFILDTIEVNDMEQSCIEFEGLPTPFASVIDICPERNGEMVIFDIDGLTGCINYTGVELGIDTACIEVCDVFGFCDTIEVIVIVSSGDLPPHEFDAINDTTTTSIEKEVVFNALGNDLFGTISDMYLVSMPDNGIATFNLDGTISYQPIDGFCNDTIPEVFDYAICNEEICDTATVYITVECKQDNEFTIYTAVSPNGDGINDFFLIEGIEEYPNNTLQVFNRWGNQVVNKIGYKNEWKGNWGAKGELLPDGTYFYLFDTGEGEVHSGYLEIRR